MCCDGGVAEENCHCGVACALRIREATSFSLEKEVYLYLAEAAEWMGIDVDLN